MPTRRSRPRVGGRHKAAFTRTGDKKAGGGRSKPKAGKGGRQRGAF